MSAEPNDLLRAEVRRLRRQLSRREAKALIVTDTGPSPTDTSRTLSRAELAEAWEPAPNKHSGAPDGRSEPGRHAQFHASLQDG